MPDVATIEDVAIRAGVSVATVSRALRGLPHVSPATRERVSRIAAELDYRPNPHASRLAAGRSGTIGIALPLLNSWFYGNVLAGVETVLSDDQLDMHLVTVGGREAMERFVSGLPSLSKQVDGLVIVDVFMPDQLWEDLAGGNLPVATVGIDVGRFDSVLIDNLKAARGAVAHLLELGHRRIGFIGGAIGESVEMESAEERRRGRVMALADLGIDDDPDLQMAGNFSVDGGREAMAQLLAGPRPTAVFCASDEMAIGAMQAVADAGLSVPDDVSIVGFDDQPVAAALGLTTVHQPVSAIAARAAAMVLDRVGGLDAPPIRLEVATRLEVRRTTASTI
jgi:DNA-binding LacI/PurR family transcriptional regulator